MFFPNDSWLCHCCCRCQPSAIVRQTDNMLFDMMGDGNQHNIKFAQRCAGMCRDAIALAAWDLLSYLGRSATGWTAPTEKIALRLSYRLAKKRTLLRSPIQATFQKMSCYRGYRCSGATLLIFPRGTGRLSDNALPP